LVKEAEKKQLYPKLDVLFKMNGILEKRKDGDGADSPT